MISYEWGEEEVTGSQVVTRPPSVAQHIQPHNEELFPYPVHHPNSGHEKLSESRSRCLFQGRFWVRFPILPRRVTRAGIWCDGAEILREIS